MLFPFPYKCMSFWITCSFPEPNISRGSKGKIFDSLWRSNHSHFHPWNVNLMGSNISLLRISDITFYQLSDSSSVDTNLPWSPAALINYWMTWSPRSWTSSPPRSRACNIGFLERVQVFINIPQGWFSTQVPSRGNASFCLFTSCCLTWSSASPCWACVATVCWQVK